MSRPMIEPGGTGEWSGSSSAIDAGVTMIFASPGADQGHLSREVRRGEGEVADVRLHPQLPAGNLSRVPALTLPSPRFPGETDPSVVGPCYNRGCLACSGFLHPCRRRISFAIGTGNARRRHRLPHDLLKYKEMIVNKKSLFGLAWPGRISYRRILPHLCPDIGGALSLREVDGPSVFPREMISARDSSSHGEPRCGPLATRPRASLQRFTAAWHTS
jgi:hypothetical protein